MRKIIAFFLSVFLLFGLFPVASIEAKNKNYFVVTAYYSPLPNQKYYMTGDLESEKRLQGHGIRGASGARVFSGMVAAPKKYAFGTKVYIEGLGIGNIQDRGGAIVPAGKRGYSYDRLDVWMGYGDEGLKRALAWGKRTVPGYVVSSDTPVTINYKNHPAPDWALAGLRVKKQAKAVVASIKKKQVQKPKTIYDYNIGIESTEQQIKKLQEELKKIGYYKGKVNGTYNKETIFIVSRYQMNQGLIDSYDNLGSGYWGPETRALFRKQNIEGKLPILADYSEQKNEIKVKKTAKLTEVKEVVKQEEHIGIFKYYNKTKQEQEEVLTIMKEVLEYSGEVDILEQDFIDSIYNFQLKYKLVASPKDVGAGYYGPKTRKKLEEIYVEYQKTIEENRKIEKEAKEVINNKKNTFGRTLVFGETSKEVRELQVFLQELGYFDRKTTGYFGLVTKEAVVSLQLDTGVINSKDSKEAGVFGKKTLKKALEKYEEVLLKTKKD